MTVLGVGFDRYLGGLEMTLRLRELLVEKFRQHYKSKADITTSERGMAKLLKEAERLKQVGVLLALYSSVDKPLYSGAQCECRLLCSSGECPRGH